MAGHYGWNGTAEERFWKQVKIMDSGCWEWQMHRDKRNYGRFNIIPGFAMFAHRFAWEMVNGPIPTGLCVLHKCDNPPCVRLDHLFLGTRLDNMLDAVSKGRRELKLTPDQVLEIRSTYKKGVVTLKMLAERFGVAHATVQQILNGKKWRRLLPVAS